jgi:MFS family permease
MGGPIVPVKATSSYAAQSSYAVVASPAELGNVIARSNDAAYGVLASSILGAASSFALHLVNLRMQSLGVEPSLISLSVAVQAAAICITAFALRSLIRRSGLKQITLFSVVSAAALLIATYFVREAWAFIVMRALFGFCVTASVIAAEFLVTLRTNENRNPQLIAWFTASLGVGGLVGPMLISVSGVSELHAFLIGASFTFIGGAMLLMFLPADAGKKDRMRSSWRVLLFMPATCAAALLFGVVDSAGLSLLPLYGSLNGLSIPAAANLASVAALGAIFLQFPIAWASSFLDTRQILTRLTLVGTLAAALLPLVINSYPGAYLVAFLLGGIAEGLFTVTLLTVARDRRKNSIVHINACLIALASSGEVIGPAASSIALEFVGANGIVLVTAIAFLTLGLALLVPRRFLHLNKIEMMNNNKSTAVSAIGFNQK